MTCSSEQRSGSRGRTGRRIFGTAGPPRRWRVRASRAGGRPSHMQCGAGPPRPRSGGPTRTPRERALPHVAPRVASVAGL